MSGGIPFGLEKVTTMSCGVTALVPFLPGEIRRRFFWGQKIV